MFPRGEHPRPHIHLVAGDDKASVAIDTGELIVGKVSSKRLKAAQEWIAQHRAQLLEMWQNRMVPGAVHEIKDKV